MTLNNKEIQELKDIINFDWVPVYYRNNQGDLHRLLEIKRLHGMDAVTMKDDSFIFLTDVDKHRIIIASNLFK